MRTFTSIRSLLTTTIGAAVLALAGASGCTTEFEPTDDELANEDVSVESAELANEDLEAQGAEIAAEDAESESAEPGAPSYECFCNVSFRGNGCRRDEMPVVKKSTCHYVTSASDCEGVCIGGCANTRGEIDSTFSFTGHCDIRVTTPFGVSSIPSDCGAAGIVE